ncbi:GntR family transcriptional regulator [Pararhizobium polonicum]|nr:GntR family transcriptional regulator [Pararhizobium polonicum]
MDSKTQNSASETNTTLAQTAYDVLLSRILDGTFATGSQVSEGRIANDLGLSRTPLREAIGRLEGEGLMQRSGRSVTVRAISLRDYMEVLHMRRLLECDAAGIAAASISLDVVAVLHERVQAMQDSVSSAEHWALDDDLHDAIARSTGSSLLIKTVADLRRRTRMFGRDRIPGRFEGGRQEHLRILDALSARNRGAAIQAMAEHLENAKNAILAELQRFG